MKIDAHLHLNSPTWFYPDRPIFPRFEKTYRNRVVPRNRPNLEMSPIDETHLEFARKYRSVGSIDEAAEMLVGEMDDARVDKAVLMAIDADMTNQKVRIPHWEQLKELARIRDKHPGRFLIFCGMDLRRGRAGLPLFERAVKELGCVGLKLLPHWGFYPTDKELCYPYYEKCQEWNIAVASNCSAIPDSHVAIKYCHPALWEEVAYDFPEMNICLAHSGIPYHYEYVLGLAMSKHNIYMDLGDWQTRDPYTLEIYFRLIRRALNCRARYKIMFASDWPWARQTFSLKEWVETITRDAQNHGFEFTNEELDLLFCQNVQDFLDMNLKPGKAP